MNAQQIRNAYLEFFEKRNHKVIPRALLVPYNDPTTLFTGSGMQPMIPYLLGETHPEGKRIVDSQTCLRAQDIEEIGDNRHTTFFEMIGNWSLGDYFKTEQINWMWEFLTEVIKLDPSKIYITCFIGAPEYGIPKDTEAAEQWQKLFESKGLSSGIAELGSEEDGYKRGIKEGERIFYYDGSKNWWSRNGAPEKTPVGDPCGPDSEMFYDFGIPHNPEYGAECHPNCDCGRFMEIGNNVFMAYRKVAEGQFEPLEKPNIDHGSGLERLAAAANDDPDMFKISVMWPIIEKLEQISGKTYDSHTNAMRVIADHLRAATFLAVDGVKPSNKEQGYVMRRLVRRAIRFAFDLGVEQNFMQEVVPVITGMYEADFPEVEAQKDDVIATLVREEKAFRQTLRKGIQQLSKSFAAYHTTDLHLRHSAGSHPRHSDDLAHAEPLSHSDRLFHADPLSHSGLDPESNSSSRHTELDSVSSQAEDSVQLDTGSESGMTSQGSGMTQDKPGMTAGEILFTLYDTYGFPVELSVEEAFKQGIELDANWREQFEAKMAEQRARSQTATKGTFKGGLGGNQLIHKKYHTATHLMYQALREVLGDHVVQNGSNITEERLRFDFSHPQKVTPEEIKQVEDIVNEQISKDLKVSFAEYPTKVAREEMGALGQFGDRYGDTVKVYKMIADGADKPFSFEICGGPHVDHTLQLFEDGKHFKIIKEEASSAGIRRIKAVLA